MHALEITNLTKTYQNKNSSIHALKGINFVVKQGDFFALLGPNGAGKSTTIGIIASLVNKSSGHIKVFGVDIEQDWSKAKSYIGVVPQEINFNQFETIEDVILNQAGFFGISRQKAKPLAEKYLKQLGLWDRRHSNGLSLSGGMKRRVMIVRALIHEPKLLILDEPTAGVDIELRRSLWDFITNINKQGTSIILTTHYLEEAENLCKNIAIINHGKIIINSDLKTFLTQLDKEYFLFFTQDPLDINLTLGSYNFKILDSNTIEVEVPKATPINNLFQIFSEKNVVITSMKNKSNRLEELFFALTKKQ
ncbi:MAG: ABC transporter ATP-binding protein [Gammaproteobacteria bacterium]|nr:ABC transporter ATP-binding protein [Gammaproteobacteria bacterium]